MKGEERRDQILELSKSIFSDKGYYETHVEDIIRLARIGKGTFYRYFKNKEELFTALLVKFLNEWKEAVFIDPSEFRKSTILEQFNTIIQRSFAFFKKNEALCNIYLRIGPGINNYFEPYMLLFEKQMLDYIELYLNEGIKLGLVKGDIDVELTANILAGAFLRVDYYYFVIKKKDPVDVEELAERFFHNVMKGILVS